MQPSNTFITAFARVHGGLNGHGGIRSPRPTGGILVSRHLAQVLSLWSATGLQIGSNHQCLMNYLASTCHRVSKHSNKVPNTRKWCANRRVEQDSRNITVLHYVGLCTSVLTSPLLENLLNSANLLRIRTVPKHSTFVTINLLSVAPLLNLTLDDELGGYLLCLFCILPAVLTSTLFVRSGSRHHEILHSGSINFFHKEDITLAAHVLILRVSYDEAHEPKRLFDPCIHRVILIRDTRVLRTNQSQCYGQCTTETLLHPPCNGRVTHCPQGSNKLRPGGLRSVVRRTFVDPLQVHAWYATIHNLPHELLRCLADSHHLGVRQGGSCSPALTRLTRLDFGCRLGYQRRGSKRHPMQRW